MKDDLSVFSCKRQAGASGGISECPNVKPGDCVILKDAIHRRTSNMRRTWVGNKVADDSDVVGASPDGAAPNTSSFSI